jgi:hypothetical protein
MNSHIFPAGKLIALALVVSTACATGARAQVLFFLEEYSSKNIALKTCAETLIRLAPNFGMERADDDTLEDPWDDIRNDVVVIDIQAGYQLPFAPLSLLRSPFLIRSAESFQRIAESDLVGELLALPQGTSAPLAVAYGGFNQFFSHAAAFTNSKHFPGKIFVADNLTTGVLLELGGIPSAKHLIMNVTNDYLSIAENAFSLLDGTGATIAVIEAPTSSIEWMDPEQRTRFIDLAYSSLQTIVFGVSERGFLKFMSLKQMHVFRDWANAAAQDCSIANYDAEVRILGELKTGGVTIVPFDRADMVTASWKINLVDETRAYTVSEMDRLATLDEGKNPKTLPSTILKKMSSEKRKLANTIDAKIKSDRAAMKASRAELYADLDARVALLTSWHALFGTLAEKIKAFAGTPEAVASKNAVLGNGAGMTEDEAKVLLDSIAFSDANSFAASVNECIEKNDAGEFCVKIELVMAKLARAFKMIGQEQKATEFGDRLTEILMRNPSGLPAQSAVEFAWSLVFLGNPGGERIMKQILASMLDANNPVNSAQAESLSNVARAMLASGDPETATLIVEVVAELSPDLDSVARARLGEIQLEIGQTTVGFETLSDAIASLETPKDWAAVSTLPVFGAVKETLPKLASAFGDAARSAEDSAEIFNSLDEYVRRDVASLIDDQIEFGTDYGLTLKAFAADLRRVAGAH